MWTVDVVTQYLCGWGFKEIRVMFSGRKVQKVKDCYLLLRAMLVFVDDLVPIAESAKDLK